MSVLQACGRRGARTAAWAAVLVCAAAAAARAEQEALLPYNEIVCYVNNDRISKRDVEGRMDPSILGRLFHFRDTMMAQGRWDAKAQRAYDELYYPDFRKELRQLVKERLLLQEARERKLEVNRAELKKRVDDKVDELKQHGLFGTRGFSQHEVQERMQESMLIEECQGQIVTALDMPNRREVEAYYQAHRQEFQRPAAVKLRLLRVDAMKMDATGRQTLVENAREKAEELYREVACFGRKFEDVARENSDDAETRARGGLLLGRNNDEYTDPDERRALAPIVRRLNLGEVSDVFRLDANSYAIVLLEDRRPAGLRPLDDELYRKLSNQLANEIIQRKEDEWFRKTLQRSLILDGQTPARPIPLRFFFPDDPTLAPEPDAKPGAPAPAKNGATPKER